MAYDPYQKERIQNALNRLGVHYESRNMMGGYCVMVNDKMCFGLLKSKADGQDLLMVRIGEDSYSKVINEEHVLPMDFTGRPMKGYAFVQADGFDMDDQLDRWLQLCLDFNPIAKSSKKKKKT